MGHDFLVSPSTFDTTENRSDSEPKFRGSLRQRQCFTIHGDVMIPARVIQLFTSSRPFDVSRHVAFVVIDAFQRVLRRRARLCFSEPCHELTDPPFVHVDAMTSVVLIRRVIRIRAALNHLIPDLVFRRVCSAMRRPRFPCRFTNQTTTTARGANSSQLSDVLDSRPTTVALTFPERPPIDSDKFRHQQASEPLTEQIDEGWHKRSISRFRVFPV